MPLTKLDANAALIVIDLQKGSRLCRPFTPPGKSSGVLHGLRVLSDSEGCRSF
jgi:hypothetical protein